MIVFFYFTENIKVNHRERDQIYEHRFEGVTDKDLKFLPFEQIYFSTPSDFNIHMEEIKLFYKGDINDLVKIVNPEALVKHELFPKHIGFEKSVEEQVEEFKGRPTLNIAILNAMSNALGDHLIGMQAFNYWQEKLKAYLGNTKVNIAFFQLNAVRLKGITKQWHPKFQNIYMMPNRYSRFIEFDAFVDLGSLLARDTFDTQPMIDFFFEALSIDSKTVPDERKRMKYTPKEQNYKKANVVIKMIKDKSKGKPVLLFHRTSTSGVREMRPPQARKVIKRILDQTNYFVVSADGLEYFNDRFLDLSFMSNDFEDFVSIISNVDAIVTVDTSTYHFADAFSKPTVVMFTTIEPKFRIPYYPFADSVMLEKEGGLVYGLHHISKKEEEKAAQMAYVDKLWEEMDVSEIVSKLKKMEAKCVE